MLEFFPPSMEVVRRLFFLCLAIGLLSSGVLATVSKGEHKAAPVKPVRPNIILITLDTTRADRMGFLGSHSGLTPNLDVLAKQSVIFTKTYAQVPLTTPSHAALLTGTYPQYSHLEDLGAPLAKDLPYLPDLLHQRGYKTAAFIGAYILDPWRHTAPGFERGFDFYDTDYHTRRPGEDRYHSVERRAEEVANRALRWLSTHPKGPFFVWLHFYDAHDPYDPPSPFKERYADAPYDGEISYTDSVVGSFLAVLKRHALYENSVIAIAADHGEAFGEHGEERHGMFLYDETLHVPLLLKLVSGKSAGRRVDTRVALADIAPTLLQAAGVTAPPAMQAQSLFPLIDDSKASAQETGKPDRPIYSETNYGHRAFGWAELRSWRAGKYLYVQAPKQELYDQSSDPDAKQNLATASKAVAETLSTQLDAFHQKTERAKTESAKLDPSQVESLRALGYLASDNNAPADSEREAIDPKDKIEVANALHRALVDIEEDRYDEAIRELQAMVQQDPGTATGYLELGRALVHQRRYQAAIPILRTAAEKNPDSGMAHYELALALIKTGQWEEALPEMKAAVVCTPSAAQMHFYLAAVYLRLKRIPEATPEFDKALELDANHFLANLKYGEMLLLEGDAAGALPRLKQAVKVDPKSAEAHSALANAYLALGQKQNAERERALGAQSQRQAPD